MFWIGKTNETISGNCVDMESAKRIFGLMITSCAAIFRYIGRVKQKLNREMFWKTHIRFQKNILKHTKKKKNSFSPRILYR